jgi:hypothetical protein
MEQSQQTLHLTDKQKEAVIGWMLKERDFLLKCRASLTKVHFGDLPLLSDLFETLVDFARAHDRTPTVDEMEGELLHKYPLFEDYNKRKQKLLLCQAATTQIGIDSITPKMNTWLQMTKLREAILAGQADYNKGKYDSALSQMATKMSEAKDADFSGDDRVKLGDPLAFLDKRTESVGDCCTFGHADIDEVLLPGSSIKDGDWRSIRTSTKGGLEKGTMTVIVGPSNSGKSTTIRTIVKQNIMMGKSVLLLVHEQKSDIFQQGIYQAMSNATAKEMSYVHQNDQLKNKLTAAAQMLETFLYYLHWVKPGKMFVEDVMDKIESISQTYKEKEFKSKDGTILKPRGKGFDMVVCDYPALLKSRVFMNSRNASPHEEKGYIYRQFQMLAQNMNVHVITPQQSTREGFKVSRGDSNRLLDQSDIAEAWAISQIADNVLTINRGPVDKAQNTIKYNLTKSRSGATEYVFVSKTDFGKSASHGPHLPMCVFEPGNECTNEKVAARLGTITVAMSDGKNPKAELKKDNFTIPDSKGEVKFPDKIEVIEDTGEEDVRVE